MGTVVIANTRLAGYTSGPGTWFVTGIEPGRPLEISQDRTEALEFADLPKAWEWLGAFFPAPHKPGCWQPRFDQEVAQ